MVHCDPLQILLHKNKYRRAVLTWITTIDTSMLAMYQYFYIPYSLQSEPHFLFAERPPIEPKQNGGIDVDKAMETMSIGQHDPSKYMEQLKQHAENSTNVTNPADNGSAGNATAGNVAGNVSNSAPTKVD